MNPRIRSVVRELKSYQPGEQPKEAGILKLNTNENPYPPSLRIAEFLREGPAERLRRYPDPVCSKLRETLARYHDCTPEQIFVGNGSDEVLRLCVQAFVERDGSVGFHDPSYSLYPVLAATEGVEACPVSLADDFSWRMPADVRSSLFFLANPNAPTSVLYPKPVVRDFCRRFPGVVLIDEAYVDFSRDHCMDLALSLDNVLVARTLSKSFSLAGLRVGYVVGNRELIEAFYKIKDSYNVDFLAQELARIAIEDAESMRQNVRKIVVTRVRVSSELMRLGFHVEESETNFLWIRHNRFEARELYEKLRSQHILVRHFPGERTGHYLRVTIGLDCDMDLLIKAVGGLVRPVSRP